VLAKQQQHTTNSCSFSNADDDDGDHDHDHATIIAQHGCLFVNVSAIVEESTQERKKGVRLRVLL